MAGLVCEVATSHLILIVLKSINSSTRVSQTALVSDISFQLFTNHLPLLCCRYLSPGGPPEPWWLNRWPDPGISRRHRRLLLSAAVASARAGSKQPGRRGRASAFAAVDVAATAPLPPPLQRPPPTEARGSSSAARRLGAPVQAPLPRDAIQPRGQRGVPEPREPRVDGRRLEAALAALAALLGATSSALRA